MTPNPYKHKCLFYALVYAPWLGATPGIVQGTYTCHFGTQPGFWITSNGSTYVWQLHDEQCQLQDLIGPHIQYASEASASPDQQGILFFGDSVDFRFVQHYCGAIGQVHEAFLQPEYQPHLTGICRNNSHLTVAKQHISGANLHGPYWHNIHFPPIQSIEQGLKEYKDVMGVAPNVIVIASNFWDLASWFAAAGWTTTGSVMEAETLLPHTLQEWRHNMTQVLSFVKEAADEGTLLIYHTLHSPRWHPGPTFWEHDTYITQHVSQLNAVGRHVAQSLHYHILDLDLMAAQVHPDTLLDDSTHPKPWFILQALNVILNMDLAHRRYIQAASNLDLKSKLTSLHQRLTFHRKTPH